MRISFEVFWMPKAGNTLQEYEDAFWLPGNVAWPPDTSNISVLEVEGDLFRFAIADGATETSFSGSWARALCVRYGGLEADSQDIAAAFFNGFSPFQKGWQQTIETQPLAWFAEEKARSGAFSSLLGLSFFESLTKDEFTTEKKNIGWEAMAVGDSCLFLVREDMLVSAFPLSQSKDFNNSPFLLSSVQNHAEKLSEEVKFIAGDCKENDVFYLVTDAIAASLLADKETEGNAAFALLSNRDTSEKFANWVENERSERNEDGRFRMRNDDVTLIRIRVSSSNNHTLQEDSFS